MRLNFYKLIKRIIDKLESKLFIESNMSNKKTILNFVHIKKTNLFCYVSIKKKPIIEKTHYLYLAIPNHLTISLKHTSCQYIKSQII